MTTYTVIYEVDGVLRPKTHTVLDETEAIRFAATHEAARIRRDSDMSYYDRKSGTWIKTARD